MIQKCTHKNLMETIHTVYDANVPLMVWGAPGIGKSTVIRQEAEKIAGKEGRTFVDWNTLPEERRRGLASSSSNKEVFIYCDVRLSQYDPSDWAIPWANDDSMVWMASSVLKAFSRPDAKGIFFLDELPQAIPAVQNAAYQIILDRGYKDVSFPDIRVIAAGNRASDGGSQYAFAPALANRLMHIELDTPAGDIWVKDWASKNGINPYICAFIMHDPSQLYETSGRTENRRFAWPSPRSWEGASKLLNTLGIPDVKHIDGWTEQAQNMLYISVGRASAIDFVSFMEVMHDINLEEVLKKPETINHMNIDQQLGVMALFESFLQSSRKKDDADGDKKFGRYVAGIKAGLGMHDAIERKEFRQFVIRAINNTRRGPGDISAVLRMHGKEGKDLSDKYVSIFVAYAEANVKAGFAN